MKTTLSKPNFFYKTSRILLSILLTFILSIGMLSAYTSTAWAATTKGNDKSATTKTSTQKAIYVALGDSVPAGYGLENKKDCLVNLFSNKMTKGGYSNKMFNYAVSGDTASDLLTKLEDMKSTDPDAYKTLKKANVITINIGGNNVLGPLIKAVNEKLEEQLKTLGIKSITTATSEQIMQIGTSLYSMTLDETQLAVIKQGSETFSEDFPNIIKWVQTKAPNATIIVSTIYNPIPSYLSFYNTSDTLLKQMNAQIKDGAKTSGYYVADVFTAITKEQNKGTQVINLNLGQYYTSPISIDIHPNVAGHKVIADLHNKIFKKINSLKAKEK